MSSDNRLNAPLFDLNEPAGDVDLLLDLNEPVGGVELLLDLNEPAYNMEGIQDQQHTQTTSPHETKRTRLSNSQRVEILLRLMNGAKDGKLRKGAITQTAHEFNLSTRCISKSWNKAKRQREAEQRYDVSTNMQNFSRKRIQASVDNITSINMGDRSCIRDLASKLNLPKSTVHRMIKRGIIKPHTYPLHPGLKEDNKKVRLSWILSLLQGDTAENKSIYHPMYDFIHLDEKWFYLSKKRNRCYLAKGEKGQYRSASSSKFIPKVMFTSCVARPRYNAQGECTFDRKIGIFPFTFKEPRKRKSKNRDKGTMITKIVDSVNQKVTRSMLIDQIIPAIIAKWPSEGGHKTIFIQQDNAKAHITQQDKQWQEVYQQPGFTFILIQQPPNSPDLNILDLGFFRSIQTLMHKKMPKDVDGMLDVVHEAFYELDPKTLSSIWVTLQHVMNEVLKDKGGNNYDLPHVNKKKMDANGRLNAEVKAPQWAVRQAWDIVHGNSQHQATNQQLNQDIAYEEQEVTEENHDLQED